MPRPDIPKVFFLIPQHNGLTLLVHKESLNTSAVFARQFEHLAFGLCYRQRAADISHCLKVFLLEHPKIVG